MHRRTLFLTSLAAALPAGPASAQSWPETLVLMEKSDHRLAFLDPSDGRRTGEVDLPEFPHEFVVDRAGRHAFVGHYGVESSASIGEDGCQRRSPKRPEVSYSILQIPGIMLPFS